MKAMTYVVNIPFLLRFVERVFILGRRPSRGAKGLDTQVGRHSSLLWLKFLFPEEVFTEVIHFITNATCAYISNRKDAD